VLSALKDIFRSEFLNGLVMNSVCRPPYVNLVFFFFYFIACFRNSCAVVSI